MIQSWMMLHMIGGCIRSQTCVHSQYTYSLVSKRMGTRLEQLLCHVSAVSALSSKDTPEISMGQANPRFVSWAAREGRVDDLVYHLQQTGPDGLKPAPGAEKHRTPLHLAAIGGYTRCISILFDTGESSWMTKIVVVIGQAFPPICCTHASTHVVGSHKQPLPL